VRPGLIIDCSGVVFNLFYEPFVDTGFGFEVRVRIRIRIRAPRVKLG
jgi:hypothetical protein